VTPGVCLDCGASVGTAEVCDRCRLPQLGPGADVLRENLSRADDVLLALRSAVAARANSVMPVAPLVSSYPPNDATGPAAPPPHRRPSLSAAAVLLGLGAVCVVVAAVVFVSVAWSDLSLAAKAIILLGVTGCLGAVAAWAVRRRLRGSAEAFAALFVILTVLDFVAARAGGLAGVGDLSWTATQWISGGLLLGVGAGWALVAERSEMGALNGVQGLAVVGLVDLVAVAFDGWQGRAEYVAFLQLIGTVFVWWLAHRLTLRVLAGGAGVVSVLTLCAAVGLSLGRLLAASTLHSLWGPPGDVYGWLVCCGIFAAASGVERLPAAVRVGAAAATLTGLAAALLRPLEGSTIDVALILFAGAALVLGSSAPLLGEIWGSGARVAALAPGVVAAGMLAPSVAVAVVKCVSPVMTPWARSASLFPPTLGLSAAATPVVAAVGLAVLGAAGVVLARRRLPLLAAALLTGEAATALGALNTSVPLWALVILLLVLAALAGVVWRHTQSEAAALTSSIYAALSLVVSLGSDLLTAVDALAIAALLVGAAALVPRWRSSGGAGTAVWLLALSGAAWCHLAGGGRPVQGMVVAAVAASAALLAQYRPGGSRLPVRSGLEVAAVPLAVAGIGLTVSGPVHLQIVLTLTGAAAIVVSLVSPDRRPASIAGGFLLAAASWARLIDEHVSVVEAYTLPTAVVLVGVGGWQMRLRPTVSSMVALAPGLALALLPSLARTLGEPTSLRALILGLCALGIVLLGAYRRVLAALLLGSWVVAVLAFVNVGPLALALPRWVLFAAVGAGLLFLGLTWESRRNDLRAVGRSMERLR